MESLTLHALPRSIIGKQVKKMRSQGKLPVILYGRGVTAQPLTVERQEFNTIFQKAGASTLVNLQVEDNQPVKVLLHEPQSDSLTGQLLHADIYQVKMTEKIHTEIPLHFIGEAPAVTELEGNLITNRDNLEVECLPNALVPMIEVDLGSLKTFDDNIHISDIIIPDGIEVLNDPEEVIALVTPPRSEEELEEELAPEAAETEQAAIEQLAEQPATEESTET